MKLTAYLTATDTAPIFQKSTLSAYNTLMDSKNPQRGSEQKPGWTFKPGGANEETAPKQTEQPAQNNQDAAPDRPKNQGESQEATWTASEFIANHKTAGWYMMLLAAIVVIAGLTFFLTGDWISSATIVIVGSLFAVLAGKKPRQLSYKVDSSGITIGGKFYPYHDFKSFTVLHEGSIGCINLLPLKRFMPELSIYYPPDEEEKILDVLSASLPNDQKAEQGFDRLMRKIRF